METITHRPLTEEEKGVLREYTPNALMALWPPLAAGAFFFLLLSIPILLLGRFWNASKPFLPVLFGIAGVWVLLQAVRMYKDELKMSRGLREDLNRGEAEVRQYTAVEAIRVEEREDEGTGFFLKLSDGQILFLCGEHFYQLEDQKRFPSEQFELVIAPNSMWSLNFEASGDYLPVTYSRPPFPEKTWKEGTLPCEGDLFVGDFDALKSDDWPPRLESTQEGELEAPREVDR